MNSQSVMALTSLIFILACESPEPKPRPSPRPKQGAYKESVTPEDGSPSSTEDLEQSQRSLPTPKEFEPGDPNEAKASRDFPQILFKLVDPPSGKSDIYSYNLSVESDAAVSHYAHKIDSPENCALGNNYKVETAETPLAIEVGDKPDGPLAICLLAYHFPTKQWMAPSEAQVFTWEKIPFIRAISATFDEFDPFCEQSINVTTEIQINGKGGTYFWTRDPGSQGCDDIVTRGKDVITIETNNEKELKGFWASGQVSGWFHFLWSDKGRTQFTGTYGFGEPGLFAEGSWNSNPLP